MWKNLGINYNWDGTGYNPAVDFPLLYNAGFRKIRLLIVNWDQSTQMTLWKSICLQALAQGFTEVVFGITFTNYSVANQAGFTSACNSLATWFNAQTIPAATRLVFCLGNEEFFHVTDGSSFAQVRTYYNARYTAVKAILTNPNIDVTYSMANGEMFNFFNAGAPYPWDYPSANLYTYTSGQNNATSLAQNIANASGWFGLSTFVVSEFAPDPNGYSDAGFGDYSFYTAQFMQNLSKIRSTGINKAYIYNFMVGDSFGIFGCMDTNRNFRPWWYALIGQRQPLQLGTG